jgi:hypothetical protein
MVDLAKAAGPEKATDEMTAAVATAVMNFLLIE